MKKILCLVSAIVLVLSLSIPALATGSGTINLEKQSTTEVTFKVDPSYIIEIPAKIELEENVVDSVVTYENDCTISATKVRLQSGQELAVSIDSDFVMLSGEKAELPYTITKDGTEVVDDGIVATFQTKAELQTQMLHISAGNPTYAGVYSDTVTFTIAPQSVS